ncbi:hypothetical protein V491_00978 [Pseudogymnoascus sp. VKM F-3775]|nr:hypothetical protein V491_00978 [Pseudogymnoascus sp. VKM F-3775]
MWPCLGNGLGVGGPPLPGLHYLPASQIVHRTMLAGSSAIGFEAGVVCTLHAARGVPLALNPVKLPGDPRDIPGTVPCTNAQGAHAMVGSGVLVRAVERAVALTLGM